MDVYKWPCMHSCMYIPNIWIAKMYVWQTCIIIIVYVTYNPFLMLIHVNQWHFVKQLLCYIFLFFSMCRQQINQKNNNKTSYLNISYALLPHCICVLLCSQVMLVVCSLLASMCDDEWKVISWMCGHEDMSIWWSECVMNDECLYIIY